MYVQLVILNDFHMVACPNNFARVLHLNLTLCNVTASCSPLLFGTWGVIYTTVLFIVRLAMVYRSLNLGSKYGV